METIILWILICSSVLINIWLTVLVINLRSEIAHLGNDVDNLYEFVEEFEIETENEFNKVWADVSRIEDSLNKDK